jgi:hypothetical protein
MIDWVDYAVTGVLCAVNGLVGWYLGERAERRRQRDREGLDRWHSALKRRQGLDGPPPPKGGYRETARLSDCDHRAELLELRARITAAERWHKCDEEKP